MKNEKRKMKKSIHHIKRQMPYREGKESTKNG